MRNTARVTVTYAEDENTEAWVPTFMEEEYQVISQGPPRPGAFSAPERTIVEGHATYSNFRRFSTAGKVIIR